MNVAVIGASNKEHRYSYKAVKLLLEKGHAVFPVHQRVKEVEGMKVYPSIVDIEEEIDTVTLYVSADISSQIAEDILSKHPRRIIFNPGAENPDLEKKAREAGVETVNACTLVMLSTSQFQP